MHLGAGQVSSSMADLPFSHNGFAAPCGLQGALQSLASNPNAVSQILGQQALASSPWPNMGAGPPFGFGSQMNPFGCPAPAGPNWSMPLLGDSGLSANSALALLQQKIAAEQVLHMDATRLVQDAAARLQADAMPGPPWAPQQRPGSVFHGFSSLSGAHCVDLSAAPVAPVATLACSAGPAPPSSPFALPRMAPLPGALETPLPISDGSDRDEAIMRYVKGDFNVCGSTGPTTGLDTATRPGCSDFEPAKPQACHTPKASLGFRAPPARNSSIRASQPCAGSGSEGLLFSLGPTRFYQVRSLILKHQEVFTRQVFDLHKLQTLNQMLLAEVVGPDARALNGGKPVTEQLRDANTPSQNSSATRYLHDVSSIKSIPSSIRRRFSGNASQSDGLKYTVPRATPGVFCPVPSKLDGQVPVLSSGAVTDTKEQGPGQTTGGLSHASEVNTAAEQSLRVIGVQPSSSVHTLPIAGSNTVADLLQEHQQQLQTQQQLQQLLGASMSASQQLGFDPHQFWVQKHFDRAAAAAAANTGGPCPSASGADVPSGNQQVGAGPCQPSASTQDFPAAPKALRWWQDAGQTFGEPGLLDPLALPKPSAPTPSMQKVKSAQCTEVTSGHSGSKGNSRAEKPSGEFGMLAPLKKRAKYTEGTSVSMMLEYTVQRNSQLSGKDMSTSNGARSQPAPKRVAEKKAPVSAFKKVPPKQRNKRGTNHSARMSSACSDNSSCGFEKKAGTKIPAQSFGKDSAQSTAKSAAGILLSMSTNA